MKQTLKHHLSQGRPTLLYTTLHYFMRGTV